MKVKHFAAVMFGALILCGLWTTFMRDDIADPEPKSEAISSQINKAKSFDHDPATNKDVDVADSVERPNPDKPVSMSSESVLDRFPPLADERYVSNVDIEAYRGYSDEELSDLGESGDKIALHVLADRAGWQADYDSYEEYMIQALDYGSATAAPLLSVFNSTVKLELAKSPEETLQAATDSIAWLALAQIQGVEGQDLMFTNLLQDLSDREVEVDFGEVRQRVKVLADDLQSRRNALGLSFPLYSSEETIARVVDAKKREQ